MTEGARPEQPAAILLAYALPALPLAVLTLPFYVIVPTFYNALGLPLAAVGTTLLAIRLIDAAVDPAVGLLADRLRIGFGRRRTLFAIGVPLVALASVMVFLPPSAMQGTGYLFLWGTALSLGWTLTLIPYQAWGTELSGSYAGRSRVSAFREGMTFFGTLIALALPEIVKQWKGTTTEASLAPALALFASIVAVALPLAAILTLVVVPEPRDRSSRRASLGASLAALLRNRPFLRLVAAYLLNGLANGLPATLFVLFVTERLKLGDWAGLFLIVYFAAGLAGIPFWLWFAGRSSKHRSWSLAMLLASAAFIFAPLLPAGSVAGFLAMTLVTGLAVGADLVLPASLQADVIDIDTAESGIERSATYLAFWGLSTKLALALAAGIAFPALAAFGFDPGVGQRSEAGLIALALLYAGLPVLLKLGATALIWRFPLDAASQQTLRQKIEGAVTSP